MEEYLTKSEFSDRSRNAYLAKRSFNKQLGLVEAKYPQLWKELHRFSLNSLRNFGFRKRNTMTSVIQDEITNVVLELKSSVKEYNGIHKFDGYFTVSILNIIWSILAGKRYEHNDSKLLRLVKVTRNIMEAFSVDNLLMAYPEWKNWFPNWTGMTELIDERRMLGLFKTHPENLVDEFLREAEKHEKETTSNTLTWCILFLMLNPRVQRKLQEEIDSVVPQGTFPTVDQESQLHYLRAVLAETHRMNSETHVSAHGPPSADKRCGTYISAHLHAVHYDKRYWKDPQTFRPERFIDGNGNFKSDPRLKPFGFGKRMCPGESLVSMNLMYFVCALLRNFTFQPVPNELPPSTEPVPGASVGPHPFQAWIECRTKNLNEI
ncbi:unnamed protein product [Orchesella dallaii]|uniref:Methyl farnesoate epoxidase n=1 Tax=Orchesella dallaii TaxID=48710 RepID=A0ABP1QKW0_9HEXA